MPRKILPGNAVSPYVSGDTEVMMGGEHIGVIEETRVISTPVAAVDLTSKLPINAIVTEASIRLTGVTATTAVKVGIGRKEAAADPDKYALTTLLTNGTYGGSKVTQVLGDPAIAETLQITACDTAGVSAGTLNTGTIVARVTYRVAAPMPALTI
ncbi:MAG: hypothetical protein ACRCZS_17740 [Chroococcidiopsis sp.]